MTTTADYQAAELLLRRAARPGELVVGDKIRPQWIDGGARFWYAVATGTGRRFVLVDPGAGTREPLFDHTRLAASLAAAANQPVDPDGLPFAAVMVVGSPSRAADPSETGDSSETAEPSAVEFAAFGAYWRCRLDDYTCAPAEFTPPGNPLEVPSPDGTHAVSRRGDDLWVRSTADGREWALTTDGAPDFAYGPGPGVTSNPTLLRKIGLPHLPPAIAWSPDSTKVLAHRIDEREVRQATFVESLPADGGLPTVRTQRYAYPGDEAIPMAELVVLDVAEARVIRARAEPVPAPQLSPIMGQWAFWAPDGSAVYYLARSRDLHTLELRRMDPSSGEVTTVLTETGATRVDPNQWFFEPPIVRVVGAEVLWYSQRDGWGHLYRYDLNSGALLGQVTSGEWAVRQILHVDEGAGVVYLAAVGLVEEDPYRRTVCRVGLDGTGFARVIDDELDHVVTLSPDGAYVLDSASTVDQPPVTSVRDWSGRVLVELERADVTKLAATGWTPPERFRVKAADGVTDIYGVLYRPRGFDPARRYPVVDSVYPGPQVTRVDPCFDPGGMGMDAEPLAALGFVVVAVDGRGTPGRSKAFHDAAWGHLADAGSLEDHVAALRQLAESRPWMDLERLGVFGHSGGGYAAARAMLAYPDVYQVGVALAGSHDPATNNQGWIESCDGADNPEAWARASNLALADRLAGRLLLVHGEMDDQNHPDQTLRLVDRLIAANKGFQLLIVPGAEHLFIDHLAYVRTVCWDFLVRELAGEVPPAYRPGPIALDEVIGELFG